MKEKSTDTLSKAELLELLIQNIKAMQKSIEEKKMEEAEAYNKQIIKLEKIIRTKEE